MVYRIPSGDGATIPAAAAESDQGSARLAAVAAANSSSGTRRGRGAALVVDDQGGYRGILSQSDIVLNQGAEFFLKLKHLDTILDPERRPLMTPADTPLHEAISLMRENGIPIVVFSIRERGNLMKVIKGQGVHTVIEDE